MPSCPKCGKEVGEWMSFCPHCGSRLAEDIELLKVLKALKDIELLRLKVEELRHEERTSLMLGIFGFVFLSALGALIIAGATIRVTWQGIPYEVVLQPYADWGAIVLLLAAVALLVGGGYAAYCSYKRSKLLKQLESLR